MLYDRTQTETVQFYFSSALVLCEQSASTGPFCSLVSTKHTFLSFVFFFVVVWLMLCHRFASCIKYFLCLEPRGENTYTRRVSGRKHYFYLCTLTFWPLWGELLTRNVSRRCLICEEAIHITFVERGKKVYAHMQKIQPLSLKVFHFSISYALCTSDSCWHLRSWEVCRW